MEATDTRMVGDMDTRMVTRIQTPTHKAMAIHMGHTATDTRMVMDTHIWMEEYRKVRCN